MKSLHITFCIATLATLLAACAAEPGEEAIEEDAVAESAEALVFQQGDQDITWSGPATYGARWANLSFRSHPGLFIFQDPMIVRGAIYLSPQTLCQFTGYNEIPERIFINSNDCSGPYPGLTVSLNCLKLAGQDLHCTGTLTRVNGMQSGIDATLHYETVCAPDGCYDGPFDPTPDPDGDCPDGSSPCGASGCCNPGERCGDGKCWVPDQGDNEVISP